MLDTGQSSVMATLQRLGAYPACMDMEDDEEEFVLEYMHGVGYKAENMVSRPVAEVMHYSEAGEV